jgi:hypothetical protein
MTGQSRYYVEKWDQNGTRAKWFEKLPSLASVRSLIEDVRQAKTGEIVRVIPYDASPEELKALRKLVRPSWIQVVDHNTDRQSENETACCKKLQRISELRDHSISLHSPNAWFQHGDTKLENPRYFCIERDLQGLDDEAWAFLKGEALPRLIAKDPSQIRGWQQLFDTLNEARGYNHLV